MCINSANILILKGRYCYLSFIDEEIEVQKSNFPEVMHSVDTLARRQDTKMSVVIDRCGGTHL